MDFLLLLESIETEDTALMKTLIEGYTTLFESDETDIKGSFIQMLNKDSENYFLLPERYQLDEDLVKYGQKLIRSKPTNYDKLIGDVKRSLPIVHALISRRPDYIDKLPDDVKERDDFKEYYNAVLEKKKTKKKKTVPKKKAKKDIEPEVEPVSEPEKVDEINVEDTEIENQEPTKESDDQVNTIKPDESTPEPEDITSLDIEEDKSNVDDVEEEPKKETSPEELEEDKSKDDDTKDEVDSTETPSDIDNSELTEEDVILIDGIKDGTLNNIDDIPEKYHTLPLIQAVLDEKGILANTGIFKAKRTLEDPKIQEAIMVNILNTLKTDKDAYSKLAKIQWVRYNPWISLAAVMTNLKNVVLIPSDHAIHKKIIPYTDKYYKKVPKHLKVADKVVREELANV